MSRGPRRGGIVVLLALALLATAACSSDADRIAEHVRSAEAYRQEGKLREASLELRQALQLRPQDAELHERLGDVLERDRRLGDALFFYREAYRLDPQRVEAATAAARLLAGVDDPEARPWVEALVERHPDHPAVQVRRSVVALLDGEMDEALAAALVATELAPDQPEPWVQLGRVHQARIRAARLQGDAAPAEAFPSALAAFERAMEMEGPGGDAELERARLLGTWPERVEEAEQALLDVIRHAEEAGHRLVRARAVEDLVSYAVARRDRVLLRKALQELVQVQPDNLAAWVRQAQMAEQEEEGAGQEVFRELVESRPDDPISWEAHALYLESEGRADEALARLEEGMRHLDDPPELASTRIAMLDRMGRGPEAAEALERLRRAHPRHPRTALALARRAIREGRLRDAAEWLRPLEDETEEVEPMAILAEVELRAGRLDQARRAIALAERRAPLFDAELVRLRAAIHRARGDWPAVRRACFELLRNGVTLRPGERLLLARALRRSDSEEAGLRLLDHLAAQEDASPAAVAEFASVAMQDQPDEVRQRLDAALARHPADRRLLAQRARLALQEGDLAGAAAHVDKALAADVAPPGLLLLRAEIRERQGDLEGALEDARRAFVAGSARLARPRMMSLAVRLGRLEDVASVLEAARLRGDLDAEGTYALTGVLRQVGRTDQARSILEDLVASGEAPPRAKNDLAYLLALEDGDLDRALELSREAVQAMPESAGAADTLGLVLLKKGLHAAALEQFDAAARLDPTDSLRAVVSWHRGLALQALGREDSAAEAFRIARQLDPQLERLHEEDEVRSQP